MEESHLQVIRAGGPISPPASEWFSGVNPLEGLAEVAGSDSVGEESEVPRMATSELTATGNFLIP
jgi:hypothetical protein